MNKTVKNKLIALLSAYTIFSINTASADIYMDEEQARKIYENKHKTQQSTGKSKSKTVQVNKKVNPSSGVYFKIGGGVTSPKNLKSYNFKVTPLYKLGVGYKFNEIFRTDLELRYNRLESKKTFTGINATSKISHAGAMVNGYLNLSSGMEDIFVPYLTAGIGYAQNKLNNYRVVSGSSSITQKGGKENSMIWGAGVGGVAKINDRFGIDVGYRYMNLGKVKGSTTFTSNSGSVPGNIRFNKLLSHEFNLGLVINL